MKLKPEKCSLFQSRVKFLGSIVSADDVKLDPEKVQLVTEWLRPQNLTEAQAFVMLASYCRHHVEFLAEIARLLHKLAKKNMAGPRQEEAFRMLKRCLIDSPVLPMPINRGGFFSVHGCEHLLHGLCSPTATGR